jgi:hypothetical protein
MALARPAATARTPAPAAQPHRPAPFSPADFAIDESAPVVVPTTHIRRCTFRRVMPVPVGRRELQLYSVACTHPSYDTPAPLGSLAVARDACAGCTLPGTFRPDED